MMRELSWIVDINHASPQELIFLPGVGTELAQRIVAASMEVPMEAQSLETGVGQS